MKIALLAGGPSLERGISLNSARSVLDHLEGDSMEIVPIYFDHKKNAYKISKIELYSNNPSDFDFKLGKKTKPLSEKALVKLLKSTDIVFPAMHGSFGEDGQIQAFLEKNNIPYIGSSSSSCKKAFNKYKAAQIMRDNGFYTLPSAKLKIYESANNEKIIKDFFKENKIKKAVVKPITGGSSIGVFVVKNEKEAFEKTELIFSKRMDTKVILEPYAEGREFTVIILKNKFGLPVAILPTEIEMALCEGRIFDFRKKYLPTNQVKYHCPARFDTETIQKIRVEASQIFSLFEMDDFARFDGWVFPDGNIWFSDLNPVSGMEQNSFLFQQTSRLGMTHTDLLRYIVKISAKRQNIKFPELKEKSLKDKRKPVSVIFGGSTSERQVSLMSGTNVWLKLRQSKLYKPTPYLLGSKNEVWELPYSLILNHTVEEVIEGALIAEKDYVRQSKFIERVQMELKLSKQDISEPFFLPRQISFQDFVKKSKFVFLGLHGGAGENGAIQKILEYHKVKFNGSGELVSELCMDKFNTGNFIRGAHVDGVSVTPQKVVLLRNLKGKKNYSEFWKILQNELSTKTLIAKPKDDGCSTGIAHLYDVEDLKNYLHYLKKGEAIPAGVLRNQESIIEMPSKGIKDILFERFVETDIVRVKAGKLQYKRKSGWVEVTIGLLEKKGDIRVLSPSITVAEGDVLSLEEKFQGGTGVNITPPPSEIMKPSAIKKAKRSVGELAEKIGLKGYARIDCFMNTTTGELLVIEVNSLPGLTSSTVLFHQGLAENPPIYPRELLENIIQNSNY